MPSASLERRLRVVSEIESVRSSSFFCSSIRVRVVLPAPEGEERINIRPRLPPGRAVPSVSIRSLDILRLFAQLLHFDLQFQADRRQGGVVRFCTERVGLAPE